jgi:hypothetical protein
MQALHRYARFYGLKVDATSEQADLAAQVARHFDGSLEVEEHESISAFVQRLRNGERGSTKRQADKDRRAAAAADKKRRKSNSRKRQRDASAAHAEVVGGHASNGHAGGAAGGAHHHHDKAAGSSAAATSSSGSASAHHHPHDKAAAAPASSAASSSASAPSGGKPTKRGAGAAKKKDKDNEDNELYCICNLPSYGNMIACDGKKCPNPSQWYHLECVGLADGRHPDTWLCPECDPKGFAAFQSKKKKTKHRSKSPGAK